MSPPKNFDLVAIAVGVESTFLSKNYLILEAWDFDNTKTYTFHHSFTVSFSHVILTIDIFDVHESSSHTPLMICVIHYS